MANTTPGIQKYTVQESQNLGFGQKGSVFLDLDATSCTPTGGNVVIAITMLTDCVFDVLTAEDSNLYIGTATTGFQSKGDALSASADTFPKGITIYGRWTTVSVNANDQKCICYIG